MLELGKEMKLLKKHSKDDHQAFVIFLFKKIPSTHRPDVQLKQVADGHDTEIMCMIHTKMAETYLKFEKPGSKEKAKSHLNRYPWPGEAQLV